MRTERRLVPLGVLAGLGLVAATSACVRTPDAADSLMIQCQAKNQEVVSKDLKLTNGQSFYVGDRRVEVLASGRIQIFIRSNIELQGGSVVLTGSSISSPSIFKNRDISLKVEPDQDNTVLTITMNCSTPQK